MINHNYVGDFEEYRFMYDGKVMVYSVLIVITGLVVMCVTQSGPGTFFYDWLLK